MEGAAIELPSRILDSSALDMERFATDSTSRHKFIRAENCKFLFVLDRSIENPTRSELSYNKRILQNLKTFKNRCFAIILTGENIKISAYSFPRDSSRDSTKTKKGDKRWLIVINQ